MKYQTWLFRVQAICAAANYRLGHATWRAYFDDGMTPQQAVDERLRVLTIGAFKGALARM